MFFYYRRLYFEISLMYNEKISNDFNSLFMSMNKTQDCNFCVRYFDYNMLYNNLIRTNFESTIKFSLFICHEFNNVIKVHKCLRGLYNSGQCCCHKIYKFSHYFFFEIYVKIVTHSGIYL